MALRLRAFTSAKFATWPEMLIPTPIALFVALVTLVTLEDALNLQIQRPPRLIAETCAERYSDVSRGRQNYPPSATISMYINHVLCTFVRVLCIYLYVVYKC